MRTNVGLTLIVVVALAVIGGCGVQPDETLPSPPAAPAGTTTTVADPTAATTTTTTTMTPTTTATVPAPTTTLPGEPVDFVRAGTVAGVAGVAFDDMFVLRALPGDDQPVSASLPPLTELVLTGNGRELDQGSYSVLWVAVTGDGMTGWISQSALVYLGAARDVTAETVSVVGVRPTAPTMLELGEIVTDAIVPSDPDFPPPEIVVAAAPSIGPTSVVVYDTFPGEAFGDDAAIGSRYRITGRQVPADELPQTAFAAVVEYELVSVERFSLCTRGVDTPTGACV